MIRFNEFLLEGTFVGMKFDKRSQDIIHKYQIDNDIPNPIIGNELHVTVVYSEKKMHGITTNGILENPILTGIREFDIFGENTLVGLLDSPTLEQRHIELLARYKGVHSFDSYRPHVSLSYDYTGNVSLLKPLIGNLTLINEYMEVLNETI